MTHRTESQAVRLKLEIEDYKRVGEILPDKSYSRAFAAWLLDVDLATVDRWIAQGSRGPLYPTLLHGGRIRRVSGKAILRCRRLATC